MARTPRKSSISNTYHIILRGTNKQIVFEDENDYYTFLDSLTYYKESCNYEILSYCLMTNHVHLLMKFNGESVSDSMKKIADWYVWRFNHKYERVGHLFQERFKSEPVEDNRYLLTVARYIIQNPINAYMTNNINYKWSSYHDYNGNCKGLTDTNLISGLFENHDKMMEFFETKNTDHCMENYTFRSNDAKAMEFLKRISGCGSISEFQKLREANKAYYLAICLNSGIGISQLSRLTGMSRKILRNIKNKNLKEENVGN